MSSRDARKQDAALVAIRSRPRILELLAQARRDRCVLTMVDGSGSMRSSTILSCEPDADLLLVGEPTEGWPDSSRPLRCSVRVGGLSVHFQSRLAPSGNCIAVPDELTYREHRSRFRARVQFSEHARIDIDGAEGNLRNLSTTGFGGWFDKQASVHLDAGGDREHDATLQFAGEPALTVRVRIRHLENAGRSRVRIGGNFVAPRPEDLRSLRRWSMEFERFALRQRRKMEI